MRINNGKGFAEGELMKVTGKAFYMFISLIFLSGLGSGVFFFLTYMVGLPKGMNSQLVWITLIASASVLLSAMTIANSLRALRRQSSINQTREDRAAAYHVFSKVWSELLQQTSKSEIMSPEKRFEAMLTLNCLLVLYGSPGVVNAHLALQAMERELGAQDSMMRTQFAETLLVIRNDLGSESTGLTVEQLDQLFFADANKVRSRSKANSYQDFPPRVSLASNS
jgi:hypothetical protein